MLFTSTLLVLRERLWPTKGIPVPKPKKSGKARQHDQKVVFVYAPTDVADRLALVAAHNHRSVTAEAVVAFERYLKVEEARIRAEAK